MSSEDPIDLVDREPASARDAGPIFADAADHNVMRVLVYQQLHAGHYYYYLHYLLPELLDITSDVVVALTAEGMASAEFADLLAPFVDRVTFEATLPSGHERIMKGDRWKLHTDMRAAITRLRPDYVLAPSGDPHSDVMSVFRLAGLGGLPGGRPGEVGIHLGRGAGAINRKQVLLDHMEQFKLALSGWRRVHLVNLLYYEWIRARGGPLARSARLLPHPVKLNTKSQLESRRGLGLPEQGRLLAIAGVIDYRKAVGELLAAFRLAAREPDERVLLAGPLEQRHRRTIHTRHQDLIDSGRLIILDRFLDADANQTVLSAADIVCTPYPGFTALSSVLLEGLAAGKPILTNNLGWCRMIVERFGAGWSCDISDPEAFARAVRVAFDQCGEYRPTEATRRLLAFHAPENFAAGFLAGLREFAGLPPSPNVRPWSWVGEALQGQSALSL